MSTLYLHIGTPKTGTTAIQVFMRRNNTLLKKQDCIFPEFNFRFDGVRPQRNGHFLCPVVKDENIKETCFNRIFELSKTFSKIILTDEELWNSCSDSQGFWNSLYNKLNDKNIKLKVIVYLRRQDEYFASHWAQKIKGVKSQTFTFDEFLKNRAGTNINLDYYTTLKNIGKIIGDENIIVRPYEFSQFKQNSIIRDFLNVIGIDYDDNFIDDNTFRNVSVEGNVLEVKRYLNMIPEFQKKGSKFQSCLVNVQNKLKNSGEFRNCSTFVKGQRRNFMEKYLEGNKKVAEEFLNRDNAILFEKPLPENDPESKNYSAKELKMILEMLSEANKWDSTSPFTQEEFKIISDKALNLILEDNSAITKLKKTVMNIVKLNIY